MCRPASSLPGLSASPDPETRRQDASLCFFDHLLLDFSPSREDNGDPWLVPLAIMRLDGQAIHDWRELQRIKNEIVGDEIEAVELYPAESRLLDTANWYWLWCFAGGGRIPFGFHLRSVREGGIRELRATPLASERAARRLRLSSRRGELHPRDDREKVFCRFGLTNGRLAPTRLLEWLRFRS